MSIYLLALLIGIVAGLRTMTAPAAVAWAIYLKHPSLDVPLLTFLGNIWVRSILTALGLIELIVDQLPSTPNRTVPVQFGARILSGAISGAAIGATSGSWVPGLLVGTVGAVLGTFGGRAFRAKLAAAFGSDRPAALTEDAIAIVGAVLIGVALR
jgi:uncharacterized membrane protein